MTIHYHCADISKDGLLDLAGRHLLVSHAYPRNARQAHELGQSVLLDNGAFSVWRAAREADWSAFYEWCNEWFDCPTTWGIVPDVIDGGADAQDALLLDWPHGHRGAPVWHMDEPIDRLVRLTDEWPRVCVGSTGAYAVVGDDRWHHRMTDAFNTLSKRGRLPWLHGLRMQSVSALYPFGSVDSADIARNQNRPQNTIPKMAERWDRVQPRIGWQCLPLQQELV
jgi:hypothetical protein